MPSCNINESDPSKNKNGHQRHSSDKIDFIDGVANVASNTDK